jgi:hypothetical protein
MIGSKAWMEMFKRKVVVHDHKSRASLELSCEAIAMRYLTKYYEIVEKETRGTEKEKDKGDDDEHLKEIEDNERTKNLCKEWMEIVEFYFGFKQVYNSRSFAEGKFSYF